MIKISLLILYKNLNENLIGNDLDGVNKAIKNKHALVVERILKYKDRSQEDIKKILQNNRAPFYAQQETQRILNDLARYQSTYSAGGDEQLKKHIKDDIIHNEQQKRKKRIYSDFKDILEKMPHYLYSVLDFLKKDILLSILFSEKPSDCFHFNNFPEDKEIERLFQLNEEIFQLLNTIGTENICILKNQFIEIFKLIFLNYPEDSTDKIARYTYTFLVLFGNLKSALDTLENAENFFKINHIKEICKLTEYLPIAPVNLTFWQEIIKDNPTISTLKMFKKAQEIEKEKLFSNAYIKHNHPSKFFKKNRFPIENIRESYLTLLYGPDYSRNKALSKLCESLNVSNSRFKKTLILLELYKNEINKENILPDITIDGRLLGYPGYFFLKLPKKDLRNLYLGEIVQNCHSIGKTGEAYVIDALIFENRANYVLIKTKKNNVSFPECYNSTSKEINYNFCDIIGYGYAFIGRHGNICFDSWENLHTHTIEDLRDDQIIIKFLNRFAKEVLINGSYQRITIGSSSGNKTPKYYKQTAPVVFPELIAGGHHPNDSLNRQTLIDENITKKTELNSHLKIPYSYLSQIISCFQTKILEGLALYYPQFFKELLSNKDEFIALTGPEAFNRLFLTIHKTRQSTNNQKYIKAKTHLDILIDVAKKQSVIKEFLTSGTSLLEKLVKDGNLNGEVELVALASENHCIKDLFRNNDMTLVLCSPSYGNSEHKEKINFYLHHEFIEEISYSAFKFRYPRHFPDHLIGKIKDTSPEIIQVLLLNDLISHTLNDADVYNKIKKLVDLAQDHKILPEVLLNLSFFKENKLHYPTFLTYQDEINLFLNKALDSSVLYEFVSQENTYDVVNWALLENDTKPLMKKELPGLLNRAIKDQNYKCIAQWGLANKQGLALLGEALRNNPRLLIETLSNIDDLKNHQKSLEKLLTNLLSTGCIEFSHVEYSVKLTDALEIYKSINKKMGNDPLDDSKEADLALI